GVEHLRFATDRIGYAFGQGALYLSGDGGRTWQRQSGGALALETLDGNVIRVATTCLPGCPMSLQTAAVGSTEWRPANPATISPGMRPGGALVRSGRAASLAVFGHAAGGASNATTKLYLSGDDGAHWSARGEPCPQGGDSTAAGSAGVE